MLEETFNKNEAVFNSIVNFMPYDEMLANNHITENQFMELCNRFDNIKRMSMCRYGIQDFIVKKTLKNKKLTIMDLDKDVRKG